MKNRYTYSFFLLVASLFLAAGCSDDDCPGTSNNGLVSPGLDVTLSDTTQSPMTGVIEVYPCNPGTSVYFGNYVGNNLTPLPGMYFLSNGDVAAGQTSRPISLPIGGYNMIYWGTPKYEEPIYANPVVVDPAITLGADLSQQYFGLRKYVSDTVYYPAYDLVYAVKPIVIGSEKLSASLARKVAGIKVIVKDKNNGILSASISTMTVKIGGIAEKLNMYTGEPVTQNKTVMFPLVLSADGMQMSNATVMVFPSAANPLFQLIITLKNGTQRIFKQNLTDPLTANRKLTLTLVLGDIFTEENTGAFTIDNWTEQTEVIDIPVLD